jgi:hypothetical protein
MTRMLHPVQSSQADTGEEVVGARMFKLAKDSAVKSRTQTSTSSRLCWCPPTQHCVSRCRGYPQPSPAAAPATRPQLAPVGADPGTRDGVAAPA